MVTYKTNINRPAIKKKMAQISEVTEDIRRYKTVALLDLKKLPDSLLQKLRKHIRETGGKVRVLKKPVLERVLGQMPKLMEKAGGCTRPMALVLANCSAYELNKFFRENKKKKAAKPGDIAPFEIVVPAGDTNLQPGPALSELKTAGLNVMIKAGKIVVSKDSVVAKAGETITVQKASALQKLNIMPFEVMANMICGYDRVHVYTREMLDTDLTLAVGLADSYRDAFNLSLNASVPTEANIAMLLGDAFRQGTTLAVNAKLYSSGSIGQLLSLAVRQGMAFEGLLADKK